MMRMLKITKKKKKLAKERQFFKIPLGFSRLKYTQTATEGKENKIIPFNFQLLPI